MKDTDLESIIDRVKQSLSKHPKCEELVQLSEFIDPLEKITHNYVNTDQYKFIMIIVTLYYKYLVDYPEHRTDFKSIGSFFDFVIQYGGLHPYVKTCASKLNDDFVICNSSRPHAYVVFVSENKDHLMFIYKKNFYSDVTYFRKCGGKVGGMNRMGESPIDAVIREAKQESNIDITNIISSEYCFKEKVKKEKKNKIITRLEYTYFAFDIPFEGDYRCTSNEVTLLGPRWISVENCRKIDHLSTLMEQFNFFVKKKYGSN